jgi:hypothetical protein
MVVPRISHIGRTAASGAGRAYVSHLRLGAFISDEAQFSNRRQRLSRSRLSALVRARAFSAASCLPAAETSTWRWT